MSTINTVAGLRGKNKSRQIGPFLTLVNTMDIMFI